MDGKHQGLLKQYPFGSLDLLVQSSGEIIDQLKQEVNLSQREDLATNVYLAINAYRK